MILHAAGKDISEVVETITWGGDTRQVARTLSFGVANKHTDKHLPKVILNEGDPVIMKTDDEEDLFWGIIFDVDKTASANTINYLAYDLLFYVLNSTVSKVFDDTPEDIAAWVCGELGVSLLGAAKTGVSVYYPCISKSGYEAILAAYTYAGRQNGKKYIPLMKKGALRVIEKGLYSGVILDGDANLLDANYKTTLTKLVNKVIIVDGNGNQVGVVNDAASQQKYGTIQKTYKKEEGKDAYSAARAMFQGIEQSATASALSDTRCVAGYSMLIREPVTGLYGRFFIESDSHTFSGASETMSLTLAFDNIMDEKEVGSQEANTNG